MLPPSDRRKPRNTIAYTWEDKFENPAFKGILENQ
jgi:hypothetical protein